jgi:hypothetical protein
VSTSNPAENLAPKNPNQDTAPNEITYCSIYAELQSSGTPGVFLILSPEWNNALTAIQNNVRY